MPVAWHEPSATANLCNRVRYALHQSRRYIYMMTVVGPMSGPSLDEVDLRHMSLMRQYKNII